MFEAILKDHVFIDFDVEVLFGSDQVYVDSYEVSEPLRTEHGRFP